jgi:hypothetical protein
VAAKSTIPGIRSWNFRDMVKPSGLVSPDFVSCGEVRCGELKIPRFARDDNQK